MKKVIFFSLLLVAPQTHTMSAGISTAQWISGGTLAAIGTLATMGCFSSCVGTLAGGLLAKDGARDLRKEYLLNGAKSVLIHAGLAAASLKGASYLLKTSYKETLQTSAIISAGIVGSLVILALGKLWHDTTHADSAKSQSCY